MMKNNFSSVENKDNIPFSKGYNLVASLSVPEWFLKFKRFGFESYLRKYNSINPDIKKVISENNFEVPKILSLPSLEMLLKYQMIDVEAYTVILVNGRYCSELSIEEELPFSVFSDGISFSLNDDSEFLNGKLKCDDNALVSLNSAYLSNGVIIDIADGEKLLKPIHIISIVISDDENIFINPRVFVRVGKNVSVDIIESNLSFDEKYFENRVCQFVIGSKSVVNDYRYFNVSKNSLLVENNFFDIADDSVLNQVVFSKQSGVFNAYYEYDISQNADVESVMSVVGKNDGKTDIVAKLKHNKDDGKSNVSLFATLDDRAKAFFETSVECVKDIKDVNTKQLSKIILNSVNASGRIKPLQNIASEKVKAFHGAVVSGVSKDDLFFLESRGIKENVARALILKACLANILPNIHNEKIYDAFYNLILL